jgi:hypothetical protein
MPAVEQCRDMLRALLRAWLGCAQVSLAHWNQDEEFGGFGGPHCMVVGGYSAIMEAMASRLDVRLSSAVTSIADNADGVVVKIASGVLLILSFNALHSSWEIPHPMFLAT